MRLRPEEPRDAAAIYRVQSRAFGREDEARLVDELRRGGGLVISLVAEEEDQGPSQSPGIVGHIAFSPLRLESRFLRAYALGPLAVEPDRQGMGVGSALVRGGLSACAGRSCAAVFLVGHPGYYGRFGFESAQRFGVDCEFTAPPAAWQALELERGVLQEMRAETGGASLIARFRPEFRAVSNN